METSLDNRFWLLLIIGLPAAIYYSTQLYDRFKRKMPKGKNSDLFAADPGRILEIAQQEPSNRPPLILSILLPVCMLLLLAFGGFAIYLWISGRVAFRIDGSTILLLLLFVCAPIAVLVDSFFLEPRSYRLGRSWVYRDGRAVLAADIATGFDRCLKVLSTMQAVVVRLRRPTLVKARLGKSIITVKLRKRIGPKVGIHVMSDSRWLTVRLDGGANQRNIEVFFDELSKH